MYKVLKFVSQIVLLLSATNLSLAADCHLDYWQIIPSNQECTTYRLPDFSIRKLPHDKNTAEHIKRFCQQYEIESKFGKQTTGYCYTGEGERYGPRFRLGDTTWSYNSQVNTDRVFMADFGFRGCRVGNADGNATHGVVFVVGSWKSAPPTIKRLSIDEPHVRCEK